MHARIPRRRLAAVVAATALVAGSATLAIAANPAPDSYAFVARGDNPVDALAAAPLAGRLDAPVILTESTVLTEAARTALTDASPDHVIIAGGEVAISNAVRDAIADLLPGASVQRASGETRYDTSRAIADLFGDIDPSFLMVDGKANAAEKADRATRAGRADMADDAARFGGLTSDEYQFSLVERLSDPEEFTAPDVPDRTWALVDIIDPITFDASADGVVHVDYYGRATGSVNGDLDVYVLVDFRATTFDTDDTSAQYALLSHVTAAVENSTLVSLPVRVGEGRHTLRVVAFADGEDVTASLRSLVATFTAGASGTWETFVPPPAPPPARSGESGRSDGLGILPAS